MRKAIFIYSGSQTVKTIDLKRNYEAEWACIYALFQNGAREHESEAKGARFWTSTTVLCSRQFLQGVLKAEKEEVDIFVLRVVIYCVHRVYFELISLICVYRPKIT